MRANGFAWVFAFITATAAARLHPAAQIAAAETAFAAHSVRTGLNTAFAAHFADTVVDFAPAPRNNARASYAGKVDPPLVLDWYPAYTLAAASGDFGLSTGPSVLTFNDGSRPARHGHYISIWERQADGDWKVIIDAGSSHPASQSPPPRLDPAIMPPNQLSAPAAWAGTDVGALLDADAVLSRLSAERGVAAAFAVFAADELRFYRDGQAPLVGKTAALEALAALKGQWTWQPLGGGIARSGDLGYTYGLSSHADGERGAYLRVWQRGADGWRVMLDRDSQLPSG